MAESTIRDVAREAQLSVASVSRALNGHKSVRPETRARIQAVASRLGYVPHAGARSLSMAKTNAVGVILPDLHGDFFSEIAHGMESEATQRGLQLLLSNLHADPVQASNALRAMHGRIDGMLIMCPQTHTAVWEKCMPRGLPAVLLNTSNTMLDFPSMAIDNRAGAIQVADHLVGLGRRHFVHIAGPARNLEACERREAFEERVRQLLPDASVTVLQGDFNEYSGEVAAERILHEGIKVDAVFAGNDMMAVGCLQILRAAGVQVPDDVAIAGFDDVPIARYLSLTSARVDIAHVGARAVARLAALMNGDDVGALVEVHRPRLIIRGSTRVQTPPGLRSLQ